MTQVLPPWPTVLAIVAHPDDESFGLGAVLSTMAGAGSRVHVLCLTQGEASTLHGVPGDLAEIRAQELAEAAQRLGVHEVRLLSYPDGALAAEPRDQLLDAAQEYASAVTPTGLIAFDPSGVTGHPDHQAATEVAVAVGRLLGIGVLGWTLPCAVADQLGGGFSGHPDDQIDLVVEVDRGPQLQAVTCHASQAVPGSALWRRLELLGSYEYLRWLHRP